MNATLLKASIKSNWIVFVIFTAILFMYLSIMISMYDPDNIEAMNQMLELMPEGMINAFGYGGTATDLVSFVALYFYGFIVLLFPLIYCIIMANRLVAVHVDRGSMAYLLATPNSRIKIIFTQAFFMIASVITLLTLTTIFGIVVSEAMFSGEMDLPTYINLNLVTMLFMLTISSICFFFSCIFNEAKHAMALGGGIPILFFVINMLRNISDNYEWLQYLTLYSLYDPVEIVTADEPLLLTCIIFALIASLLYGLGILIFSRRNLYL